MKINIIPAALAALVCTTLALAQAPAVPADAAALHQQSIESLQQKKTKEAVEFAEQAVKADPTKPDYFSQLAIALSQRMGEMNFMQQAMIAGKMKKAFEKAVELDANHLTGLIGLSRYYTNAPEIAGGSLEKAKEFATRIRQLNPYLGETELGFIAEHGEQFAEALAHYEAMVALRPDHGWPHYLCGRMLAKLGRKDEARARFETALRNDPKLDAARQALAALDQPEKG